MRSFPRRDKHAASSAACCAGPRAAGLPSWAELPAPNLPALRVRGRCTEAILQGLMGSVSAASSSCQHVACMSDAFNKSL